MTREEAKEYLSALRPTGADAADPTLQPALELAKEDSELGSWLVRQLEFDQLLIEKFSSIRPPEGLRENILESIEKTARPIRSWRTGWLALAATVVLAALLLTHRVDLFRSPSERFRSFYSDALAMVGVKPMPKLDLETASLGIAEAFIEQHDAPRLVQFPQKLQAMATAGCRVFVWRQHPASLTCFRLPSGNLLHLVVISEEAVGDSKLPTGPYSESGWNLMFQKENGLIVMWASQAPMEEFKQLLAQNLGEKVRPDRGETSLAFASEELGPMNIGRTREIEEPESRRWHKSFVSRPSPNPSGRKFQRSEST